MVPRVVETGVHMASIEKPSGGYRVKYRRPLGRQKSKRFVTKDDARRFSREIEVAKTRGAWLDPTDADADIADGFDREMQAAKANRYRKVIHANFGEDAVVGGCKHHSTTWMGCADSSDADADDFPDLMPGSGVSVSDDAVSIAVRHSANNDPTLVDERGSAWSQITDGPRRQYRKCTVDRISGQQI